MTSDEARNYLQGIAIMAVQLQAHVSKLDQEEMGTLREIDRDLTDLLDYFLEEEQEAGKIEIPPNTALNETYK